MKRLILCLAGLLVVFGPICASLVRPVPVLAATPAANSYCVSQGFTPGGRNGIGYTGCVDGYTGATDKQTVEIACPKSLVGYPGSYVDQSDGSEFAICMEAYTNNTATTTPKSSSSPTAPAVQACKSAGSGSSASIAACDIGYAAGKANKDVSNVCPALGAGSKTTGSASDCEVGYDLAKNITPPGAGTKAAQPGTPAYNACNSYTTGSSQFNACTDGYAAFGAGTSEANACSSTTYPDSSDLQACQHGWETAQSDAGTPSSSLGCTAQFTDPLTWIICPVVDALSTVVNFVDSLITNQLDVKTDAIFCTTGKNANTCGAYYTAWQSFRDIALGLMTIAGLVLIISTALGLEILDAYTIRKTLPRLLIAAVAITLSWPLMKFLIQFSDDLGFGVRSLIYAPFSKLGNSIDLSFGGGIGNLFGTAAGVGGAVAAVPLWIVAGGPAALLAYVGTAALAVIVAILVLILRQIAIIMLMLLAPLALVAYILPNTQRIYRMWWESFSKALLMFPLIAAFIATGRVFSAVAIHNGGVINQLIGFGAYFAPYFMIPLTFRMAGSSVGALGNFVQSRAQGGFSALSNVRKNQRQERVAQARAKGLYSREFGKFNRPFARNDDGTRKKSSISSVLNTIGGYSVDADNRIPMKLGTTRLGKLLPPDRRGIPGFRRGGARDEAEIDRQRREQTEKAAPELDSYYKGGRLMFGGHRFHGYADSLDDDGRRELDENYGTAFGEDGRATAWRAPDNYGERMQVARLYQQHGTSTDALEAGAELAAVAPLIEQYHRSAQTNRVDGRYAGLVVAAQAGRLDLEDVVANHNNLMAAGKGDQAIKETTKLQQLLAQYRPSEARGYAIGYRSDGTAYDAYTTAYDPATGAETHNGQMENGEFIAPEQMPVFSPKVADSLSRLTTSTMSQIKSQDLDGEMAEAWVAHASEHEMTWGVDPQTGHEGVVFNEGTQDHPYPEKANPVARSRALEMQGRLKYLAQYKQADSDVGRKIAAIWTRIGKDPSELDWGSRAGVDPQDVIAGGGAAPGAPVAPGPGHP